MVTDPVEWWVTVIPRHTHPARLPPTWLAGLKPPYDAGRWRLRCRRIARPLATDSVRIAERNAGFTEGGAGGPSPARIGGGANTALLGHVPMTSTKGAVPEIAAGS